MGPALSQPRRLCAQQQQPGASRGREAGARLVEERRELREVLGLCLELVAGLRRPGCRVEGRRGNHQAKAVVAPSANRGEAGAGAAAAFWMEAGKSGGYAASPPSRCCSESPLPAPSSCPGPAETARRRAVEEVVKKQRRVVETETRRRDGHRQHNGQSAWCLVLSRRRSVGVPASTDRHKGGGRGKCGGGGAQRGRTSCGLRACTTRRSRICRRACSNRAPSVSGK